MPPCIHSVWCVVVLERASHAASSTTAFGCILEWCKSRNSSAFILCVVTRSQRARSPTFEWKQRINEKSWDVCFTAVESLRILFECARPKWYASTCLLDEARSCDPISRVCVFICIIIIATAVRSTTSTPDYLLLSPIYLFVSARSLLFLLPQPLKTHSGIHTKGKHKFSFYLPNDKLKYNTRCAIIIIIIRLRSGETTWRETNAANSSTSGLHFAFWLSLAFRLTIPASN